VRLRKITKNTIRDKVHNATIRENICIKPCIQYIEKQRIKWFGHLVRIQTNQIASRALHSHPDTDVRPRKRWIDDIAEVCKNNNTAVSQIVQHALHHNSIPRRFTAQVRRQKKEEV
jgi:hypothetical protein